jgi:AcrR family transcriptional regulator
MSNSLPAGAPSRCRLIEAAARVYAACGFRGATTRRIAEEAGVNEVTLFRLFGSKAALLEEAVRHAGAPTPGEPHLPEVPVDPELELTTWCGARLADLRERRALIRTSLGELAAQPGMADGATHGASCAGSELKRYMIAMIAHGFVEDDMARVPGRNDEAHAAGAMLMAALFGDAMNRELLPDLYPQPADGAPALYVRVFLRAFRCKPREAWPQAAGATAPRRARKTRPAPTSDAGAR